MNLKLKQSQDLFLYSDDKFPSFVAAVGTGKSMMLLLKIWKYCEKYPNSLALVIRKEYTDLRDSTIKDFNTYFGVTLDGNKEYKFPNGSVWMFRHGAEMAVLKNMNLSIAGIEQAEEFETDEAFTFIRDRLRRKNGPYRQLCLIANANGHNWIWRLFINGMDNRTVLDEATGQIVSKKTRVMDVFGEDVEIKYLCIEANTFANRDNLTNDFIADCMAKKEDAPNHYMRYIMNSHEEVDADDLLFDSKDVYNSPSIIIDNENRVIKRVMGLDVARFGNDETVFTIIEQKDLYRWEQVFKEEKRKVDTVWTSGYAMELERRFNLDLTVIDDIGVGGGVTDNLKNNGGRILGFIANANASVNNMKFYEDCNTEGFCMMADLLRKGWLKLLQDHIQAEQLMTTRFKFKGAKRHILTKEEMRLKYKEIDSPDRAKALMMAVWGTDKKPMDLENQRSNLPKYGTVEYDVPGMPNQYATKDLLPSYGRSE